uniref:Uncharacterized protein n=1 Tax=Nelumbo nucifera TaxID=4432 RepID=A0A822Y4W9_NELNU|nr:TPA_asm: hypothetical protein HUJ06_028770 [Nelumbo nucifera]
MGSNDANELMISGSDEAECSEATVEIKIKTLDSQTYTLRVNKCVNTIFFIVNSSNHFSCCLQ